MNSNCTVRIIGGKWRSRKITFAGRHFLRPTPDRVRETLFNWLQRDIADARCLELYAGSGVLSLEALSRGARHVTLIDKDPQTIVHIKGIYGDFTDDSNYTLVTDRAVNWLSHAKGSFDLVFVDPPFGTKELPRALDALRVAGIAGGYVYVESDGPLKNIVQPGFAIHRAGRASRVHFGLLAPA